jgi:hypothetical protein
MKQFLRSIKSESVTVFRAQSPLLPQLERYLGLLAVRVEWVDEPAALKQADGGVVIVPLGIDTIPQTLAIFDMIEERLLPGVWPVLATDLYLPRRGIWRGGGGGGAGPSWIFSVDLRVFFFLLFYFLCFWLFWERTGSSSMPCT